MQKPIQKREQVFKVIALLAFMFQAIVMMMKLDADFSLDAAHGSLIIEWILLQTVIKCCFRALKCSNFDDAPPLLKLPQEVSQVHNLLKFNTKTFAKISCE